MKKYCLLILAVCCTHICVSQSLLTGKISGPAKEAAELNISGDIWYQPENSVYGKLAEDGAFSFSIPGSDPVFVTLRYHEKEQRLLLSPGRPLHVTFDTNDLPGTIQYSGAGAAENMMIHAFFPPRPFFMKEFSSKNEYGKLPEDSLMHFLLPSIMREADSLRQTVRRSPLPGKTKSRLITQIKYYYALNMEEFATVMSSYTKNPAAQAWRDTLMAITGIPSMQELNSTPYAAYFLHAYARYRMMEIGAVYRKDKAKGSKMLEAATSLPFDSLMHLARENGDEIVGLIMAKHVMPPAQHERLLHNRLVYYANDRELPMARRLLAEMNTHFAASDETADARSRIAKLETLLAKGKQNAQIAFRENYRSIASLDALLAPYKGKIIYLDIWGTWCGWCKVEMGHLPALKTRMKGKDIVFLYLSNDDEQADRKWMEYVQLNQITGQHVRMNEERINAIWKTLLPDEEIRRYPTYFIFDRDGKVVVKKAKRPSDGEALYAQLSAQL